MLLALISRWNIGGLASVCKYKIPLAEPRAIRILIAKSKGSRNLTAKHKFVHQIVKYYPHGTEPKHTEQ